MADELEQIIPRLQKSAEAKTVEAAITTRFLRDIVDGFICLAQGRNIRKGANILKRSGSTWCSLNGTPEGSPAHGSGAAPYILGSTNYGSTGYGSPVKYGGYGDKGPGWTGSTAIWGATAATDTWHRDRPPLIPGSASAATDAPSYGVIFVAERIFIELSVSDSYVRRTFRRKMTIDSFGIPLSITAEEEIENDYTTGSGSAAGGI